MSATVPTSGEHLPAPDQATAARPGERGGTLRDEAITSLKRKRRFVENVVGYVTVNGILWLVWALTDRSSDGGMPWPAWVSLIWGILLLADGWKAFGPWPESLRHSITEADIERESRRLRGT